MQRDLSSYLFRSEKECVEGLAAALDWDGGRSERVFRRACETIRAMREAKRKPGSIEGFFQSYPLSTQEGIALMTLAEALLRIPDPATADALIRDKIAGTNWQKTDGKDSDWLLKLAGTGLSTARATLEGPLSRLGEPVIRAALSQAMKVLGGQFVIGQTMEEALRNASLLESRQGYLFSFDMLGEGARTAEDAEYYFRQYEDAIETAGAARSPHNRNHPGISVKLSALHPRYSVAQGERCVPALTQKLAALCRKAAEYDLCLTVDAEETERLEISLQIIRNILEDVTLVKWEGFGLAVQAYGKRALPLCENLIDVAKETGRRFQIRLVKGAYWDSEIKRAQMKGLSDYPVFTRKSHTDLSYLACAQKLLQSRTHVYPMFGTHNAVTVQAVLDMAEGERKGFEFQRLFGMGDALYDYILETESVPVQIYAPVGVHKDLLPYLVRRLLENGANSSFVSKAFDANIQVESLCTDPVEVALQHKGSPHPAIRLPSRIFPDRINSAGIDLDDDKTRQDLLARMEKASERREAFGGPIIEGEMDKTGTPIDVQNPADLTERVATVYTASAEQVGAAYEAAKRGFAEWNARSATERAGILNRIADLYEEHMPGLMALCVHEAGKTLPDALAEVREAVDFCRYYAAQGGKLFDRNGENLRSYTGESNKILLQGRGVFACISPWNFPLAIFTGQVVAALMAGNAVLAKPAEQTPMVAFEAVRLMHKAGVPFGVLHLLTGDGRVGEAMVQHKDCGGVAFTGSNAVALSINRTLAAKDGFIVPFIAETGGINAIIADSSALPEQLVDDVITSAFGSAGQRCSAARVLFVQEEIAEKVVSMLRGAMHELTVGNPLSYATDIGPLIDGEAMAKLVRHKAYLEANGKLIAEVKLAEDMKRKGHFFAPVAYEILDFDLLKEEIFGPALHVVRFKGGAVPSIIRALNKTGYGLTFGIHTRLQETAEQAAAAVEVGNIYVNRSIIGAVVGVQPFGGQGLSGTGPKAGGPHYLQRFATEKTVSVNTTAAGGNASLVMLEE
jgi:RHH-type proline utilization regulon transcriptional repressor/proline dehydrogenase/delta 1-pyrroline-5-carboxylate dehydrogenase